MDWRNKTIFLTGASSGIGEALAIDLAKKGAILGLVARRKELLGEPMRDPFIDAVGARRWR